MLSLINVLLLYLSRMVVSKLLSLEKGKVSNEHDLSEQNCDKEERNNDADPIGNTIEVISSHMLDHTHGY